MSAAEARRAAAGPGGGGAKMKHRRRIVRISIILFAVFGIAAWFGYLDYRETAHLRASYNAACTAAELAISFIIRSGKEVAATLPPILRHDFAALRAAEPTAEQERATALLLASTKAESTAEDALLAFLSVKSLPTEDTLEPALNLILHNTEDAPAYLSPSARAQLTTAGSAVDISIALASATGEAESTADDTISAFLDMDSLSPADFPTLGICIELTRDARDFRERRYGPTPERNRISRYLEERGFLRDLRACFFERSEARYTGGAYS